MIAISSPDINVLMINYVINIAIFTMIIMASYYLKKQPNAPTGINMIISGFSALVLSRTTVCLSLFTNGHYLYMLEISFAGIAAALFITASFMLKKRSFADNKFAYLLMLLFIGYAAYVVYVNKSEYLLYLTYYFILSIGFAFLAVGFFDRNSQRENLGFNLTAFGFLLLAVFNLMLISKWGRDNIDGINLFILLHLFVAFGLILSGNNLLSEKIATLIKANQDNQKRLVLIIQSSPFPIVISRLKDDRLMLANRKAIELLGILPKDIGKYRLSDFFNDPTFRKEISTHLEKTNRIDSLDFMLSKKLTASDVWLQLSAQIIDFEYEIALYSSFQDITERKKTELKLFNEATRDPLTGAYTRRFFEEFAKQEITRSNRYSKPFCLAMIDADHFKNVNDMYGHAVGDKVLKTLVATTQDTLRKSDVVCRFGGEEFLVLLVEIDLTTAQMVCDRLRAIISNLIITTDKNEEVRFTVSMGLVPSTYSTDYETLLKAVDQALYVAKNSGRNRVVALTPQGQDENSDASGFAAQTITKETVANIAEAAEAGAGVLPPPLLNDTANDSISTKPKAPDLPPSDLSKQ